MQQPHFKKSDFIIDLFKYYDFRLGFFIGHQNMYIVYPDDKRYIEKLESQYKYEIPLNLITEYRESITDNKKRSEIINLIKSINDVNDIPSNSSIISDKSIKELKSMFLQTDNILVKYIINFSKDNLKNSYLSYKPRDDTCYLIGHGSLVRNKSKQETFINQLDAISYGCHPGCLALQPTIICDLKKYLKGDIVPNVMVTITFNVNDWVLHKENSTLLNHMAIGKKILHISDLYGLKTYKEEYGDIKYKTFTVRKYSVKIKDLHDFLLLNKKDVKKIFVGSCMGKKEPGKYPVITYNPKKKTFGIHRKNKLEIEKRARVNSDQIQSIFKHGSALHKTVNENITHMMKHLHTNKQIIGYYKFGKQLYPSSFQKIPQLLNRLKKVDEETEWIPKKEKPKKEKPKKEKPKKEKPKKEKPKKEKPKKLSSMVKS